MNKKTKRSSGKRRSMKKFPKKRSAKKSSSKKRSAKRSSRRKISAKKKKTNKKKGGSGIPEIPMPDKEFVFGAPTPQVISEQERQNQDVLRDCYDAGMSEDDSLWFLHHWNTLTSDERTQLSNYLSQVQLPHKKETRVNAMKHILNLRTLTEETMAELLRKKNHAKNRNVRRKK